MAMFHEGQAIWVQQQDGSARAAIYVGTDENATWFGGTPAVYVVYPDTRSGEEVLMERVTAREAPDVRPASG